MVNLMINLMFNLMEKFNDQFDDCSVMIMPNAGPDNFKINLMFNSNGQFVRLLFEASSAKIHMPITERGTCYTLHSCPGEITFLNGVSKSIPFGAGVFP